MDKRKIIAISEDSYNKIKNIVVNGVRTSLIIKVEMAINDFVDKYKVKENKSK